jgi:NtrC-family two-component system sensor histidine kinase KinB
MKIKTKLTLGVGMLFIMIILLAVLGTWYINALKKDTENILIDNYNTLEYSRNMLLALDESRNDPGALQLFQTSLSNQLRNITETGEKEATLSLGKHFDQLKQSPSDSTLRPLIRKDISEVMRLNMEAIKHKSNIAKSTASSATIWIVSTGTLCFLFAFVLLVNLPGNIAEPIRELTERIRSIAAQNYSQRVTFGNNDEFRELAHSFNTMAEKLQEYHSSNLSNLLMEKKRIETLINNMKDPVIGLDEKQQILFVNQEALNILSLKATDLIGKTADQVALTNDLIRSLIQPEQDSKTKDPVKIYADQKESYFQKELIPIEITPTGEQGQMHIGHVIVLKNITPFKELDFAKTNFIATVSHELKTPIASVKMSLQLLKNKSTGPINEEQQQLIDSIEEDSNRLLKITGELLNMTQVETGNIQMNIQESKAEEIVNYAVDAVAFHAEQKNIKLELHIEEHLPPVKADPEKTSWVMINFLTNAIRYSREYGMIRVTLKRQEGKVLFSVQDNGKGIDERYTGKIFDRYFQVPGSSRSGTGLGLAISKEFIEAQGGIVGVESVIGTGSRFYFLL